MTTNAVGLILDKVWHSEGKALIFIEDLSRFDIRESTHDWELYPDINVLVIFNKELGTESYIDCNRITEIIIDGTKD